MLHSFYLALGKEHALTAAIGTISIKQDEFTFIKYIFATDIYSKI